MSISRWDLSLTSPPDTCATCHHASHPDHGDVDIHNVAVAQRLVVGDAVADDMIDRGAERVAVAAIAQAGGKSAMRDDVVVSVLSSSAW